MSKNGFIISENRHYHWLVMLVIFTLNRFLNSLLYYLNTKEPQILLLIANDLDLSIPTNQNFQWIISTSAKIIYVFKSQNSFLLFLTSFNI